jgi:6-phosphogluconolactonase (cycloisomerase 2 family)
MNRKHFGCAGLAAIVIAGVASVIGSGGGDGTGLLAGAEPTFPRYAFVVSRDDDSVSTHLVDSLSGRLKFISRTSTGDVPVSIAVDPLAKFAYVANFALGLDDGTISKYAIGTDGALTEISLSPTATKPSRGTTSVAVGPNSEYVFAANMESNDVLVYSIQDDGDLLPVPCADGTVVCGTPNAAGFATGLKPSFVTLHPSGKYAYVANSGDDTVSQYNVAGDGTLAPMTTPTVDVGAGPWSITVNPSGNHAYIALSGTTKVSTFTIEADGRLVSLDSDESGTAPRSVAVDPFGRYAYAANSGSDDVGQFAVGADGSLTAMTPVASVAAGSEPYFIVADPSGRYTYVANFGTGDDTVSQFKIGDDGALLPNAPNVIRVPSRPRYLAITGGSLPVQAVSKFAYVANSGSNSVSQFTIGTDGTLSPMTPPSVLAGTEPVSVTVDPSGRYAYVAALGLNSNAVFQFTIGTDGILSPMSPAFEPAGVDPVSVTVDPSGRYAYVAASGSDRVFQFTIGTDGMLSSMTPSSVFAGTDPVSVTVDPSGRYAYVAASGSDRVFQFTIGTDGTLSSMTPSSVLAGTDPVSVTVDPSGRYAYVAASGLNSNRVFQFNIGADGALRRMTPAFEFAEFSPVSVTVDPTGKYVYVANKSSNTVSQYTVRSNGTLRPMAPPTSVTVDPSGRYAYVAASGSNSVFQFTIGTDGALSPMTPAFEFAEFDPVSVTTVGTWN